MSLYRARIKTSLKCYPRLSMGNLLFLKILFGVIFYGPVETSLEDVFVFDIKQSKDNDSIIENSIKPPLSISPLSINVL